MTRPCWLRRAVRNRHRHAVEQASCRWRGGRRSDSGTRRKILISTQATTAGDLLKQYGGAYLLTSTSFAIVSFAICYTLVSNGVDVAGLLGKIGIEPSQNAQTGGTFAIAYAAHKAASPIRFPPTVALTPVVAKMLGKDSAEVDDEDEDA